MLFYGIKKKNQEASDIIFSILLCLLINFVSQKTCLQTLSDLLRFTYVYLGKSVLPKKRRAKVKKDIVPKKKKKSAFHSTFGKWGFCSQIHLHNGTDRLRSLNLNQEIKFCFLLAVCFSWVSKLIGCLILCLHCRFYHTFVIEPHLSLLRSPTPNMNLKYLGGFAYTKFNLLLKCNWKSVS